MKPDDALVENDAHRPEIRGRAHALARELLWRHERGRSDGDACGGPSVIDRSGDQPRDAEVDEPATLGRTRADDHEVARLDVSVDNSCGVQGVESLERVDGDFRCALPGDPLLSGQELFERSSVDELHDEERRIAVERQVVQRDERRV